MSDTKKTPAEILSDLRASPSSTNACQHCFHPFMGAIWMVMPDGHVMMKCCHCGSTKTQHASHVADKTWRIMRGAGGSLAAR